MPLSKIFHLFIMAVAFYCMKNLNTLKKTVAFHYSYKCYQGCHGRDRMVVGFNAYQHYSCEFESRSWQGILDIALCYKVCQ